MPPPATTQPDCLHWIDVGLPNIDTPHWLLYRTAADVGIIAPKLTVEPAIGVGDLTENRETAAVALSSIDDES